MHRCSYFICKQRTTNVSDDDDDDDDRLVEESKKKDLSAFICHKWHLSLFYTK